MKTRTKKLPAKRRTQSMDPRRQHASPLVVAGLIYGEGPECPVPDEVWYQAMEMAERED